MTEGSTEQRVTILLPQSGDPEDAELVVRSIVELLREDPATRAAFASAGTSPAEGFLTLADLDEGPPPAGVPFYNEAIGVLSVPAPPGDSVRAVRTALGDMASGLDIQAETTMRTQ